MNRLKRFSAAAVLSIAAAALNGCGTPASGTAGTPAPAPAPMSDGVNMRSEGQNVITVNGSETVKIVPDIAQIRFGITIQAQDAKACQDATNKDLAHVLQFLKESGIPEESIQTSNYGMNPVYDYSSGRTPVGYESQATIIVSDITLDQAAALLTACVDEGINNIDSISYTSSEYKECYEDALVKAIDSAREKAQALAEAGGCTLGSVVRIEELSSQSAQYDSSYVARSGTAALMGADMIIEPGQVSVEAMVSVDFAIQ